MSTRGLFPIVFLLFVAACSEKEEEEGDASPTPTDAPAPPVGDPLADLLLGDGWTNPRSLPAPVNTSGWEDSSFISPEGATLYFGYTRIDFTLLLTSGQSVATGPHRDGEHGDAFDVYEARIQDNAWVVANSSANDAADIPEAAQGVDAGPEHMAFIRFELTPQYNPSIYMADWDGTGWTNVRKLPAPINTGCVEDNTHLSADGLRLYWDSDRADAQGTSCLPPSGLLERSIWMSAFDGTDWSTPVKVDGQDWTSPVIHWQPFEDFAGENLYWSGADAVGCSYGCLYKAAIGAPGAVGAVETVMQITTNGEGHLDAIGEMSITADGRYLYFTYDKVTGGVHDVSMGVASR